MGDFDVKTKQMQDAEEIRRKGRSVAARWYFCKDIIEKWHTKTISRNRQGCFRI